MSEFTNGTKRILILLLLAVSASFFAQTNVVKYMLINRAAAPTTLEHDNFLVFQDSISYYFMPRQRYVSYDDLLNGTKDKTPIFSMASMRRKDNNLYGEVAITKDWFMYHDRIPSIKWQLGNQSKTVLGYKTHNAVGKFRGREYEVWFTTQIPFEGGPWKLFGLPGLILQADTKDGMFSFIATKIDVNSEYKLPDGIEAYYDTNEKSAKPFKEYIAVQDAQNEKLVQKILATSNIKGTPHVERVRNSMLEKYLEWQIDDSSLKKEPERKWNNVIYKDAN